MIYDRPWSDRRNMAVSMTLGAALKQLREDRGWTRTKLAKRCGMHREVYSRLETGIHLMSIGTLQRVAGALHVPVSQILASLEAVEWHSDLDAQEESHGA
jgi:transcriptional regulator with XRE-family HTH domain